MEVTEDQKTAIQSWVDQGATLNEVQKRLKEELGISITYLETRFLLSDLGITLVDARAAEREKDKAREEKAAAAAAGADGTGGGDEDDFVDADLKPAGGMPGRVTVSVDTLTQPGTMISGTATFSGGEKARWYLDQLGRLGLDPDDPTFRPSEADVLAFQRQLQEVVSRQGF